MHRRLALCARVGSSGKIRRPAFCELAAAGSLEADKRHPFVCSRITSSSPSSSSSSSSSGKRAPKISAAHFRPAHLVVWPPATTTTKTTARSSRRISAQGSRARAPGAAGSLTVGKTNENERAGGREDGRTDGRVDGGRGRRSDTFLMRFSTVA